MTQVVSDAMRDAAISHSHLTRLRRRSPRRIVAAVYPAISFPRCAKSVADYFVGAAGADNALSILSASEINQARLEETCVDLGTIVVEGLGAGVATIVLAETLANSSEVFEGDPSQIDVVELPAWAHVVSVRILTAIAGDPALAPVRQSLFERQMLSQSQQITKALVSSERSLDAIARSSTAGLELLRKATGTAGLIAALLAVGATADVAGVDNLDDALVWVAERIAD